MTRIIPRRPGFTLVEMLIVVAIIALLITLLIPAVHKAREAGARTECLNNLRNIGLACAQHHTTHKAFPSGGLTSGARTWANNTPAIYTTQRWGWCYQILPYIDQAHMFNNKSDAEVIATPMPFLYCPSRARPKVVTEIAVTDYAGNGGTYGTWYSLTSANNSLDGVFVPSPMASGGGQVNLAAIVDGQSSTLLAGEKWLYMGWYDDRTSGGGSAIDNEGWTRGWDNDTICFSSTMAYTTEYPNPAKDGQFIVLPQSDSKEYPDKEELWTAGFNFGSAHGNGFSILLCDSTARFIPYNISPAVWYSLCSRNDGQPVDLGPP